MKLRFIYFLLLISSLTSFEKLHAQGYKIKYLDHYNNPNLPKLDNYQIWNDLTGWVDTINHKEYIIAGTTDSIYFFDVTDPTNMVLCDVESGNSKSVVNRDYECYSHYVYCVSDNRNPGSLQAFDLQYLPDSVHKVFDSDSLSFNTHSIFIDAKSKRLYLCINRLKSGGVAAMDILSLENPEKPVWISRLNVPTFGDGAAAFRNVHEVFVRNDTAYCSVEYNGLYIFDLRDLKNQKLLSVISQYPQNGYNHSSWVDASGKYLMFTDEIPGGLDIKVYDISDIRNPIWLNAYHSNDAATAHNAFFVGDYAYVSYYHDGFYIFNIKDKSNIFAEAYYHTSTYPPPSYEGYKGCWGVYPFLPSGNIAVSDMGEGIFMLRRDSTILSIYKIQVTEKLHIWPNPSRNTFNFDIGSSIKFPLEASVYDIHGKLVLQKQVHEATFELDCSAISAGYLSVELVNSDFRKVYKLIKTD
jgi:choice-of-anchor B domain-containing protein